MAVIEGTDDTLRHLVYSKKYVVIKYYADDCKMCKELDPVFLQFSKNEKYTDMFFMKIKADNNPVAKKVIMEYDLPFMITYKDGHLVDSNPVTSDKEMIKLIEKLLEE